MQLPTYKSEASIPASPGAARGDLGALRSQQANIQQATGAVIDFGKDMVRQREHEAVLDAAKIEAETRSDWVTRLSDMSDKAADGAPDFVANFQSAFDEDKQARLERVSPLARDHLEARLNIERAGLLARAQAFEKSARTAKADRDLAFVVNEGANTVRGDVEQFAPSLGTAVGAVRASQLPLQDQEQKIFQIKNSYAATAYEGLLERDPATVLRMQRAGEFKGVLQANQWDSIADRATARIRAQDAENLRVVGSQVRDAMFVLDRGKLPPNLDQLKEAVRGTEYATPLTEAIADRASVADFIRKPMALQLEELQARDMAPTADRRTVELNQRLQRAQEGIAREVRGGRGLEAAFDIGIIEPLRPVDPQNALTMKVRAAQAKIATDHFGFPVSPLTKSETDGIRNQLTTLPAEQSVNLLTSLHGGLGEDGAIAVAGSIVKQQPELAFALGVVSDRPELARDLIRGGRELVKNKEVAPGKGDLAPVVADIMGNAFELTGGAPVSAIVDATNALYAARRVPGADFRFDRDTYEKALRDVMGEPFRFNGRTIMPPIAGMDGGKVRDLVQGLSAEDLTHYGNGAPVFKDGKPFTAELFKTRWVGSSAQLVSSGFGRYLVNIPGQGFVGTADGKPYELDLAGKVRGR